MESSRTTYYLYKYLPVAIGVFILLIASVDFLFPELRSHQSHGVFDRHSSTIVVSNLTGYIIAGVIGFICVMAPLLYQHRIVVVRLTEEKVVILQGEESLEYDWQDVTQLKLLRRYKPTMYKLRVKDDDDYFLFGTGNSVITDGKDESDDGFFLFRMVDSDLRNDQEYFVLVDTSPMGRFIERKKRELEL